MGHADALAGKIKKGLCRKLMPIEERKRLAIEWMNEFTFSTSKVLQDLYLSKSDLPEMKKAGLIQTMLIDIKPSKDSRPRQMRIVFLTPKGRKIANPKRTGYSPPKCPVSTLNSHDFLAQLVVAYVVKKLRPDSHNRRGIDYWSSGHIRHKNAKLKELRGFVPDAVLYDQTTAQTYHVELERSSTLDRFFKGNRLARRQWVAKQKPTNEHSSIEYQFVKKIEHLSKYGIVLIVYCTRPSLERAEFYFNSRIESGIPSHYFHAGRWHPLDCEFDEWDGDASQIRWAALADLQIEYLLPPFKK